MKVFAEHIEDNGIKYRGKTLLQFGESFDLIGSAVLKNPGKAERIDKISPGNLVLISKFYNNKQINNEYWCEFTHDNTIIFLSKIFSGYYIAEKEDHLNGIIQLFNLHNIKDQNILDARKKFIGNDSIYLCQPPSEIIPLFKDRPVYLGWGNEYSQSEKLRQNSLEIFNHVKINSDEYLKDNFYENKFYHPLYINMMYTTLGSLRQSLIAFYDSIK